MRIIIEHGETKRVVEGPFNICGNGEDLLAIARAIKKAVGKKPFYGWVGIATPQKHLANTKPENWE